MSLDDFIEPNVDFLTCLTNDENYKNKGVWKAYIIGCRPNNILLKQSIDEYINRYNNNLPYSYWDYSIVVIFRSNDLYNIVDNHTEGIYYYHNMKVQLIKESIPLLYNRQYCFYKNKILLYNKYRDYIDNQFIPLNI